MTFGRTITQTIARNPISCFAVICVMATAAFLGFLSWRLLQTLESPAWCAKALQAEKISAQNFGGLTACVDLLKIQLQALATALHISNGSFAFSLVVLVVVVIAGARASGKLPGGVEFDVGKDAAKAADEVAGAAVDKADEIKAQ